MDCKSNKRFIISFCMEISRADVGSSKINNFGSNINTFAKAILCLCPPENSCGYLLRSSSANLTSFITS